MATRHRTFLIALLAAIWVPASTAHSFSGVQEAAAERLRTKLGTIRGSIEPDRKFVFLTQRLIERWKPIPRASAAGMDNTTTAAIDAAKSGAPKTSGRSRDANTFPDTSDIDEILRAVDRLTDHTPQ